MKTLTQKRLREVLSYNPSTGVFTWVRPTSRRVKVGDEAGRLHLLKNVREICIDYQLFFAHRLAVLYMIGRWPKKDVDHINGDSSDNRWSNLREALHAQNRANSKKYITNTSGFKGVYWHSKREHWCASICVRGKPKYLGSFNDPKLAHMAYVRAAISGFGEFARAS